MPLETEGGLDEHGGPDSPVGQFDVIGLLKRIRADLIALSNGVDLSQILAAVDGLEPQGATLIAQTDAIEPDLTAIIARLEAMIVQTGDVADPVTEDFTVLWRLEQIMLKLDELIVNIGESGVIGDVLVFSRANTAPTNSPNLSNAGVAVIDETVPVGKEWRLIQIFQGGTGPVEGILQAGVEASEALLVRMFSDSNDTRIVPLFLPSITAGQTVEFIGFGAAGTEYGITLTVEERTV
jgi:hypothetical protein